MWGGKMANEKRDLSVSFLSGKSIDQIGIKFLRRIKPTSKSEFENLPQDVQTTIATMFNQAFVIWNSPEAMESMSQSKLISLIEPYKTRKFKSLPAFLQASLWDMYAKQRDRKSREFLLWFIDKKEFNDPDLPNVVKSFVESMYKYDLTNLKSEERIKLVGGIKKYNYEDLTADQKAFIDKMLNVNVDNMKKELTEEITCVKIGGRWYVLYD